jgi:hypothetical protein
MDGWTDGWYHEEGKITLVTAPTTGRINRHRNALLRFFRHWFFYAMHASQALGDMHGHRDDQQVKGRHSSRGVT